LQVIFNGTTIAETGDGLRVLETSHPPVYYFPPEDVSWEFLRHVPGKSSFCEWKGSAVYHDVVVDDRTLPAAAWSYPSPRSRYAQLRDYLAFYPQAMDACLVNGEKARPQPGGFYGGWITRDVKGPFKGTPGSHFW
jgi:uncharacterized protein (DUF427 family)